MCRLRQINFFHNCTHLQEVLVPSLNPDCGKKILGRDYIMSEWCPRCKWSGFLAPFQYQEYASGVACGGFKDKVTREVRLHEASFEDELDRIHLWFRRQQELRGPSWAFRKKLRIDAYLAVREQEEAMEVSRRDRTYFVDEFDRERPDDPRNDDLYRGVTPAEVPREKDTCGICRGSMTAESMDADDGCSSKSACALPCEHYFGVTCLSGWMIREEKNSCPTCRQEYKIMHQLSRAEQDRVPPGWNEQREFNLAPGLDRNIRRSLMLHYWLKLLLVGLLLAPFPTGFPRSLTGDAQFLSWTNLWMWTCGAAIFHHSGIHLVTSKPFPERLIQNKFAFCSALGNTLEVVYATLSGRADDSWPRLVVGLTMLPLLYCGYKTYVTHDLDVPWTSEGVTREWLKSDPSPHPGFVDYLLSDGSESDEEAEEAEEAEEGNR
ncbi:hypothetical protein JHW43_006624 [Diplocarpon mali]|nr:hypothetical protein JHW43_006624 [Diplocarpon mali]